MILLLLFAVVEKTKEKPISSFLFLHFLPSFFNTYSNNSCSLSQSGLEKMMHRMKRVRERGRQFIELYAIILDKLLFSLSLLLSLKHSLACNTKSLIALSFTSSFGRQVVKRTTKNDFFSAHHHLRTGIIMKSPFLINSVMRRAISSTFFCSLIRSLIYSTHWCPLLLNSQKSDYYHYYYSKTGRKGRYFFLMHLLKSMILVGIKFSVCSLHFSSYPNESLAFLGEREETDLGLKSR